MRLLLDPFWGVRSIHEGKKNQIRRMFGDLGHQVVKLVRTRIGPVKLGDLRSGSYRRLSKREETVLKRLALAQSGHVRR